MHFIHPCPHTETEEEITEGLGGEREDPDIHMRICATLCSWKHHWSLSCYWVKRKREKGRMLLCFGFKAWITAAAAGNVNKDAERFRWSLQKGIELQI